MAYANEKFVHNLTIDPFNKTIKNIEKAKQYLDWLNLFIVVNMIFTIIQCYFNFKIIQNI